MKNLNHEKTPLFDALMEYVNNNTIPFHVPGHKKGKGMEKRFLDFVGKNVLSMDVTVFKQVDSLHKPTGPIKEAQELAADAFGADATFFCIHGTSGAIQAMILSVMGENEKIIVPRNIHKSVTSGIILSGAVPVYMQPEVDKNIGVALNVTPEIVEKTLKDNPDAKAVLIINPTYYGVSADIVKISEIVHDYGAILMVDEAHGPHLKFNEKLPISAMEAGADICAQSTHKIIGSMTQSSMLHVKADRIDVLRVKQVMSLLQTTSPSYILLASLDVARKQMMIEGKKLLDMTIELSEYARKEINNINGLYCFGDEIVGKNGAYDFDPTKITITAKGLGITGHELERILAEKYYIQPELSDMYNVLCIFSIGDTKEKVDYLLRALRDISSELYKDGVDIMKSIDIPDIPEQVISPRYAFECSTVALPLEESIGQISAEFLMAYPPGIPVLCPGERITREIIEYVNEMKNANLSIQGTEDPNVEYIKVVNDLQILNITA
ncbi:aminotransferase class I/II-fold pyridoxal phosphate-dependent enzyme [Aceticella autotrophica]|uniref:Aminotransferase class I/II-fold pyridoxal phosphate-dependent enzyme n=1 Tax=Aceticella autotrophica TaxID=2755338 RepID=A0A975G9F1_9THEO|nr:aminotransferase class I/II-fold pyridoxal phosphate-dependent enzyme [Aceticella autotrophica]QSZ26769.1 aminotransferase class I/II-fold pyridoxal phosphate-dependent enzyme [Aceticella autotrophica]